MSTSINSVAYLGLDKEQFEIGGLCISTRMRTCCVNIGIIYGAF